MSRLTAVAGYLLILVIALIAAAILPWMRIEGTRAYEGNQVLGVIAQGDAPVDGAVSAAKQWVTVASSVPFADAVAGRSGLGIQDVRSRLKVTAGDNAPVVVVRFSGDQQPVIAKVVADVAKSIQAGSRQFDPRYPVRPMTEVGITEQRGLGTVGLPTLLLSALIGGFVLLVGVVLFRKAMAMGPATNGPATDG